MNKAVDVINSLRSGMATMLKNDSTRKVISLRMFNFEKNRVSLRFELVDSENRSHPMGMIDVTEYPLGDRHKTSCNCHMTELATGKTEKLILKLNSQEEKNLECAKVFNFFRKVLDIAEVEDVKTERPAASPSSRAGVDNNLENVNLYPPSGGRLPDHPRGAQ